METRFLSIYFTSSGGVEQTFNNDRPLTGDLNDLRTVALSEPEIVLGDENASFPDSTVGCHLRIMIQTNLPAKQSGEIVNLWTASAVYFNNGALTVERRKLDDLIGLGWDAQDDGIPIMRVPGRGAVFFKHRLSQRLP